MKTIKEALLVLMLVILAVAVGATVLPQTNKTTSEYVPQPKEYIKVTEPNTAPVVVVNTSDVKSLPKEVIEVVTLTERNSLVFRGPVTGASVAAFQKKAFEKSLLLGKDEIVYIVIDSPGGEVIAGNMLIDSVKALPQKFKSVSLFAASMAFQMVQNFEERLITPNGTLMSHRASGGFEGEFGSDGKGELITSLNWILKILKKADEHAASRMKISLKDYQELIRDEYWTNGSDAVNESAADRMVLLKCSKELISGVDTVQIQSFFGTVSLSYSKCPIITFPLKIGMNFKDPNDTAGNAELSSFVDKLLKDRRAFVKDYIVTNKFKGIIK